MVPHHVVDGEGPAVVFVNSLGGTLEMWEPQAKALRRRFRVVRFDTRGHGGSTTFGSGKWEIEDFAEDLERLIEFVGADRVDVVGISLGGAIAMTFALRRPERIRRLALLSTAAKLGTPEAWAERAATARAEGCAPLAEAAMGRWFTEEFTRRHPEIVEGIRERFAGCDPEGYAACCEALARYDLRGRLDGIEAETLLVHGTLDETTTLADAQAIASEIEGARVIGVEGAKHLVSTERPDIVNEVLLDFLDKR